MAGTLVISTLSDGTNSTSSTNAIQGSAKAWVNFIGSSATINASYNVSSVTRTSTGLYTVNFTNAFSDNKYAMTASSDFQYAGNSPALVFSNSNGTSGTKTTSACAVASYNSSFALYDGQAIYCAFFR